VEKTVINRLLVFEVYLLDNFEINCRYLSDILLLPYFNQMKSLKRHHRTLLGHCLSNKLLLSFLPYTVSCQINKVFLQLYSIENTSSATFLTALLCLPNSFFTSYIKNVKRTFNTKFKFDRLC
jgi:hypothetical protein